MGSGLSAALSAVANVVVFGAIIWGALARTADRRRRILFALGIPIAFNVAVLLFKGNLTMDQRVWGAAATLLVFAAGMMWFQRQSLSAS
jgi:hypothetical protein